MDWLWKGRGVCSVSFDELDPTLPPGPKRLHPSKKAPPAYFSHLTSWHLPQSMMHCTPSPGPWAGSTTKDSLSYLKLRGHLVHVLISEANALDLLAM